MTGWVPVATGVGSALVGGFYLAFSAVVLPALRRRPPEEAAATMVVINQAAVRAPFMVLFFGTAAACAATTVDAMINTRPDSLIRVAGSVAYLAGWASTMAVNVPLNNRLAKNGLDQWPSYQQSWTRANHIRAIFSTAGATGLLIPTQP
ncbi:DUF1772 domain-containing protein [Kocuria arenosa]|uniref:anthrone oxygenase family protein n=1 Tax=Kocuria arenosa TaxID=3071446 RepID=UPI0034D6D1A0